MKPKDDLYDEIISLNNLYLAYKKSRKGKTKLSYVIKFTENLGKEIKQLNYELKTFTYKPAPLKSFPLKDPKLRIISKAEYRDRVIHHAIINVIEPIYEKSFIYDSYANRKGKGNLKAIERFDYFKRKASKNFTKNNYVLKADIKHYFENINHEILIKIIKKKIKCNKTILLITKILDNGIKGGGANRKLVCL